MVVDPAELFIEAARVFVAATGCRSVVLTGRSNALASEAPNLRLLPRIAPDGVQHLFAVSAERKAAANAAAATPLHGDRDRREAMVRCIAQLGTVNGVEEAVGALRRLARRPAPSRRPAPPNA